MPDQVYDAAWYKDLARFREWNERAMWAAFAHLGRPDSFLDLGCGDAWMVRTARMIGSKPSLGVEVSPAIKELKPKWASVLIANLGEPITLSRKFDLVASIEVGEHLPEENANVYCDNISNHVGQWLVFTAAAPDQNGDGHINCQPQEYWRVKFEARGLAYVPDHTERLRETWKYCTGPMFWLPQNLQVFMRPADAHPDDLR